MNKILGKIKVWLENYRYSCVILGKSEALSIDQLLISLAPDEKERPRLLIVRSIDQDLCSQDDAIEINVPKKCYYQLQFIVSLPFTVSDSHISDLARLLLLLNKGMELPGFELSEVDRHVFFRTATVFSEDCLDQRIILSYIGMIEMLLDAFSENLEAVATGTRSFRSILDEIGEMSP